MNIKILLEHDLFTNIPEISGNNIIVFLESNFSEYLGYLENLDLDSPVTTEINNNLSIITDFSEIVIESIKCYLKGQPSIAYKIFSDVMDSIWENHLKLFSSKILQTNSTSLFRCRVAEKDKIFDKNDLFHIPLDKRNLIQNQRYSINGHPSLYLGSSLLDCWLELNEPPIQKLVTSRYFLKHRNINVLDLAIDYKVIPKGLETIENDNYFQNWINEGIYTKFILFPLILAVSLRSNPIDSFKVEYIIPQLLLEWVTSNKDVDCIKYYSTRNYCNLNDTTHLTNYVFPVKSFRMEGYCQKLDELFSRSEPFVVDDPDLYIDPSHSEKILPNYYESIFHEIEEKNR